VKQFVEVLLDLLDAWHDAVIRVGTRTRYGGVSFGILDTEAKQHTFEALPATDGDRNHTQVMSMKGPK
jgi:hypothetical protein